MRHFIQNHKNRSMNKICISIFVIIFLFASFHSQELAHKDGKSKHIHNACSIVEHNHSSKHHIHGHNHEDSIFLHSHFKNTTSHDHEHSGDHYHYVEANKIMPRIRTLKLRMEFSPQLICISQGQINQVMIKPPIKKQMVAMRLDTWRLESPIIE